MSARDEHKYLQNLLMSKCNMLPLHPSTYIVCCVCCVRVCWALETIKLFLNIHKCIFYHRKICSYITKYKECRGWTWDTALPNSPDPRAETRELAAELRMRWQRHWEVVIIITIYYLTGSGLPGIAESGMLPEFIKFGIIRFRFGFG